MGACERCWSDAYIRMMTLGGSQVEHYYKLLDERKDRPCEQGERDHA